MRVNQFLNMYIFVAGGDRAAGKIDESMIKNESAVCFAFVKTDRGVRPWVNGGVASKFRVFSP